MPAVVVERRGPAVPQADGPVPSWFWLIAGINGAGKSTLVSQLRRDKVVDAIYYNPDAVTTWLRCRPEYQGLGINEVNKQAADKLMEFLLITLETTDGSVCVETVLSTDKYRAVVQTAQAHQRKFGFVYIGLESAEQAIQRVKERVAMGGHDVPEDKVRKRWTGSLQQLPWFAAQADKMLVFSNAQTDRSPVLIASGDKRGLIWRNRKVLPHVAQALRTA